VGRRFSRGVENCSSSLCRLRKYWRNCAAGFRRRRLSVGNSRRKANGLTLSLLDGNRLQIIGRIYASSMARFMARVSGWFLATARKRIWRPHEFCSMCWRSLRVNCRSNRRKKGLRFAIQVEQNQASKLFSCRNPYFSGSQPIANETETKPMMLSIAQLAWPCNPIVPKTSSPMDAKI